MKNSISSVTEYIENKKLSKFGFILGLFSTIFTIYLILNALRCFPDVINCGRTWLVLTLPVYLVILPVIGKISSSLLLVGFITISPFYIISSYHIGKNIESIYRKLPKHNPTIKK